MLSLLDGRKRAEQQPGFAFVSEVAIKIQIGNHAFRATGRLSEERRYARSDFYCPVRHPLREIL